MVSYFQHARDKLSQFLQTVPSGNYSAAFNTRTSVLLAIKLILTGQLSG